MVYAFVGVSAVADVPIVVKIPSTGFSTNSGVLLLWAFPDVPVLSFSAVDIPGILDGAKTSAFAAISTAVDVPSAVGVSTVSGFYAVASVPALALPAVVACVPTLVKGTVS